MQSAVARSILLRVGLLFGAATVSTAQDSIENSLAAENAAAVDRTTEQILMPETGLDLTGGFGVVEINPNETWIVSSEMGVPKNRLDEPNRVLLANVLWSHSKSVGR